AEDGIRDFHVTGVQTCALPISEAEGARPLGEACWAEATEDLLAAAAIAAGEPVEVDVRGAREGAVHVDRAVRGPVADDVGFAARSEERRVGKEGRARGSAGHWK